MSAFKQMTILSTMTLLALSFGAQALGQSTETITRTASVTTATGSTTVALNVSRERRNATATSTQTPTRTVQLLDSNGATHTATKKNQTKTTTSSSDSTSTSDTYSTENTGSAEESNSADNADADNIDKAEANSSNNKASANDASVADNANADAQPQDAGIPIPKENRSRPIETFQDWDLVCEQRGDNTEACFIYQTVYDPNTDNPVMQIAVGYIPVDKENTRLAAMFTVPLGIYLKAGLALTVDDSEEGARIGYDRCTPVGCSATFPINDEFLSKFKAGLELKTAINDGSQNIFLNASLLGFTDGLNRIQELAQ